MARTKQTARKSTSVPPAPPHGLPPPPPPPPPPPLGGDLLTEQAEGKYTEAISLKGLSKSGNDERRAFDEHKEKLSDVISPSMLLAKKKTLKTSNLREAQLDRQVLLDAAGKTGYLQLSLAVDFLRTQSITADVTVLNFSGLEQLTDMILMEMMYQKLTMPRLHRIALNGCHHVTDLGIQCLTKTFTTTSLNYVELCGIPQLTDASLLAILEAWSGHLEQVSLTGSSVGIIPPGYEDSIKINGCPMLSPPEKVEKDLLIANYFKRNRPCFDYTSFKMVILPDDRLPWSPLSILLGEKNNKATKKLRIKSNCQLDKSNQFNIFEAPLESGFSKLLISEGSIVMLPYLLVSGEVDPEYAPAIGHNLSDIIAECPDAVFVLMGITEDTSSSIESVAKQYHNLVKKELLRRTHMLEAKIDGDRRTMASMMNFYGQKMNSVGRSLWKTHHEENLISTVLRVSSDNNQSVDALVQTAIEKLKKLYPALFIKCQEEVSDAVTEVDKRRFPLSSMKKIDGELVPRETVLSKFTDNIITYKYTAKLCSIMARMGKMLYYPELDGSPAVSEFSMLETVYEKVTDPQQAPRKVTLRYLGSPIPAWTMKDLEQICPDKHALPLLLQLLEDSGILVCLPRDQWTTELGEETTVYVRCASLPYYPNIDLDHYWPDLKETTSEMVHRDRYFLMLPSVPKAFFPGLIRSCVALGGVRLVWNKGIVLQKGPLVVLLELLNDCNNTPVMYVGVRMSGKEISENEEFMKAFWSTLEIYRSLIRDHTLRANLYCTETVTCTTCLPTYDRYHAVNAAASKVFTMDVAYLYGRKLRRDAVKCRNDRSVIDVDHLLGIPSPLSRVVPAHNYLGCLPSFSSYNRCMFCRNCAYEGDRCPGNLQNGKTSWNCSCNREGQMCDKCGMCQRCVNVLSQVQMRVSPQFSEDGSMSQTMKQDLSPSYCPELWLHFIRGSNITLEMKLGSSFLVYNAGEGSIQEVSKPHVTGAEPKIYLDRQDNSWICKEGFTLTVTMEFSKEDADDMNVVFCLQGQVIYTHVCTAQSSAVSLKSVHKISMVACTPKYKAVDETKLDDFGEKAVCSYATEGTHAGVYCSIEARVMQGKTFIENSLFHAGGVNYSGAAYLTLPRDIDMTMLQYPSAGHLTKLANHPLCYTRSKICDALSFAGSQAVPESWSVYRMIHLVDRAGLKLDDDRQAELEMVAGALLWAWHMIYKMQAQVTLPKSCTQLLPEELLAEANKAKVETGLYELVDMGFWRTLATLDTSTIITMFDETVQMVSQAEAWEEITEDHLEVSGLEKVTSKFNEENVLYLCPGHCASVSFAEGVAEMLPEIYGKYSTFLLSVDLPDNQLSEIPAEAFPALPNLTEFDCSNNFIETLPDSIGQCKNLYSLTLAENNLADLPDSLANCKELFRLDITGNMMACIPQVVMRLPMLKRLYASNMFMTELPENIGDLTGLEKLYINGNCFSSVPTSFGKLQLLNDLGMSGVPWLTFSAKTKVVSYENFCKKLTVWRLDRWLDEHTENKKELFKFFDEDGNGILDLDELGKLNAALFNMFPRFGYKGEEPPDENTPSGFPPEILQCTSLEYLNLYYQGFVFIPPEIGNLQELKFINVSHNPNMLAIPPEISTISCLTRLELEGCPLLKTPPKEIREKGFSTTFAYLKRLMSGSMHCKRTKLMMVGLGGAGKTSLVNSLLSKDGTTNLTQAGAITDGIDICSWTVKSGEEQITYSVWDFAGQTVYYNTHQFFLSNRAVYLLVWNVRLGFEHAGLDFWLSSIAVQAPKAPIFVVGSHVDQVSKYELPINEMRTKYPQIAGFHFVSSFTGQGVKDLQNSLFEVTLQQQYMGEQIPEVWLTLENNVISSRSSSNVIEYTALEKMANISGIFDKTEVLQAVQFLHELGSLQHFTTESLKTKVVVNPQWIVDVMACVVSVKNSPIQDGRLQHKDIAKVWADYPTDLHDWLLKLTEAYDLTFPLDNEPVNLVPCLLPEKRPEFTWPELETDSDLKENRMIYKFDYLPAGLFNRGQVRLHQLSDSALIWKKGSLLNKNGHKALLQQTRASEMTVLVQGPRPENVIFLVHEVFEGLISESFRGVAYDFLIPCPDCLKAASRDPHMFASSTVRRALELKAPFLQCNKYFHTISCVDLLACMPPDNHADFDLHLVQSVRGLRDLRKDLAADVFMSYCTKDAPGDRSSVIHPATVCDGLEKLGYKCWFPKPDAVYSMDEMARALNDASVFVAFMSSDYVKDENCVNIFKYARLVLRKPLTVIAVGDGFEWRQSKLGILLSDEVFVNMTKAKQSMYPAKFEELKKALAGRTKNHVGSDPTPSCFFSYTWVNSTKAVTLGTRSIPGALGYGDPRDIKAYLENSGIKCWIDVERVGQNGLFDDIAEGLLNARVVVVCVSDEYASSPTCQIEYRYACNTLKIPTILAVVGTGNKWRASEVGVLSLGFPLVSFQEKSETAHASLLALVREHMNNVDTETDKDRKNKQNKKHKDLSFQELFELAQRKLLRQLCFYSEHQDVDVYPRLFIIDFMKSKEAAEDTLMNEEKSDADKEPKKRPLSRMSSMDEKGLSKKISDLKGAFRMQKYCVYTLCEHDEGWHSVCEPIPLLHEFGETQLDKFTPFLSRVTAVMKYNKSFTFHCMQEQLGEDYFKWLEENPQATMSDYQQVYHYFRQMVIDADPHRNMGHLARCRLPNGKTIWLCERHRQSMKVTVLSSDVGTVKTQSSTSGGNDQLLITGLRTSDHKLYSGKFTSSGISKRKKPPASSSPTKESDNMYSSYELLPDKKMPKPKVRQSKAKKDEPSTADTDDAKLKKPAETVDVKAKKLEDVAEEKPDDITLDENEDEENVKIPTKLPTDRDSVRKKKMKANVEHEEGDDVEMLSKTATGPGGEEKVNISKKSQMTPQKQSSQMMPQKHSDVPAKEESDAQKAPSKVGAAPDVEYQLSQYQMSRSKTFAPGRRDSARSSNKLERPASSRSLRPDKPGTLGRAKSKALFEEYTDEKRTVRTLIRRRVTRRLIWVHTGRKTIY